MLLSELIRTVTEGLGNNRDYGVAVLSRKRVGGSIEWGEVESFSVLDVALDEDDRNIDILTDENALDSVGGADALTAEVLLYRLRELEARCGEWSVYSKSSRIPLDPEWDLQIDIPLVGIAMNYEERVIGLLQGPDEQWRHAV